MSISDRRTFAIISHPDAGKTTLTEKLLYFGGAIHLAGEVKARGQNRRARSDWMKIEQQRGISVTSSVMTFERDGITFNLLEFSANVALFVPFGVFFVLLLGRRRWWLAILLGVAATCAIEFGQQFIPNRVSDPRDLLANSIGSIIGTLLALVLTAAKARRLRQSARLATSSS
jgi:hypothetical protein